MCNLFGVTYSIDLLSIGVRGRCILSICAFCYMCKLFGVIVFHTSIFIWSDGGRCILSICAFSYMCNLFGVTYSIDLLSIGVRGRCILSICAFCYMCKLFGVIVFRRSIVNWSVGVVVSSVYIHSAICETYVV